MTGSPPPRRLRVGISSTTVREPPTEETLHRIDADVLELCGLDTGRWARARRQLPAAGFRVGLHAPLPYDGALVEFPISDEDAARRAAVLNDVARTVDAAADTGCAYVVVHLPSPGPHRGEPVTDPVPRRRFLNRVLIPVVDQLADIAEARGVRILLENMSYHPLFGSVADYLALLYSYPGPLGMCLDLGHLRLSVHDPDLSFLERVVCLSGVVSSVHAYGVHPRTGARLPAGHPHDPSVLIALGLLRYGEDLNDVVLEHLPPEQNDIGVAAGAVAAARLVLAGHREVPSA